MNNKINIILNKINNANLTDSSEDTILKMISALKVARENAKFLNVDFDCASLIYKLRNELNRRAYAEYKKVS